MLSLDEPATSTQTDSICWMNSSRIQIDSVCWMIDIHILVSLHLTLGSKVWQNNSVIKSNIQVTWLKVVLIIRPVIADSRMEMKLTVGRWKHWRSFQPIRAADRLVANSLWAAPVLRSLGRGLLDSTGKMPNELRIPQSYSDQYINQTTKQKNK